MTQLRGNWNYPTLIRFGAGRIAELPDACRTLGIRKPLLVTDPGLAALPMVASAVELLPQRRSAVRCVFGRAGKPGGGECHRRGRVCIVSAATTA